MNKKKLIIIISMIIVVILGILTLILLNKNKEVSNNKNKKKENLIKALDVSINEIDDILDEKYFLEDNLYVFNNDKYYLATFKYPGFLYKETILSNKQNACYRYINGEYNISLRYYTYNDEEKILSDGEKFEKVDNYYISDNGNYSIIYFKTDYDFYQEIIISYGNNFNKINKDNFKKLVDNITYKEIDKKDISIKYKDGYYYDTLEFAYLSSANYIYDYVKIDYKVNGKTYYTKGDKNRDDYDPSYYDDYSSRGFLKGKVTADVRSLYELSSINVSINNTTNFDIKDEINNCKKNGFNCKNLFASAWLKADMEKATFEDGNFKYNDYDVYYYKVSYINEDNINISTIDLFLKINDRIYYEVSYKGGDYKDVTIDMVKEFLPTNIYYDNKKIGN